MTRRVEKRPGLPPGMKTERYDQLASVFADMIAHAPEMVRYLNAPSYIANAPFVVARYKINGVMNYYAVNTFRQKRRDAKTSPMLTKPEVYRDGVMRRSLTLLQDDVIFADFDAGPVQRVLERDLITEPTARQDRYLAIQLLHELFHARIALERDPNWPVADRTILAEYEKWSAPYQTAGFQGLRKALVQRFGSESAVEHLLQEKFVIQKTFALYGRHAFNEEIAAQYARRNRGDREAAVELFRLIDKAHNDVVAPFVIPPRPGQPGYVPPRKILPQPPDEPRPARLPPWIQPFRAETRFRPPPIPANRFAAPIPAHRFPTPTPMNRFAAVPVVRPYIPPVPRPVAYAAPVRRPDYGIPRSIGGMTDPARRDWFGPIGATTAAPAWTRVRPDPIRPGTGTGWNPDRFGFEDSVTRMRLEIQHPSGADLRPEDVR
jgi:hypothetical protein